MKFIVCQHNKNVQNPLNIIDANSLKEIYTLPDTAFHFNKRPFFIPDYAVPCVMHLHLAIKICRLGRNISQRFAERYFDAVTLCARMETPALPATVGRCFDECLTVGEWMPTDNPAVSAAFDADTTLTEEATSAIALVSRYFTLRQGDVLLLRHVESPCEVQINQHIERVYCGQEVLSFNIK